MHARLIRSSCQVPTDATFIATIYKTSPTNAITAPTIPPATSSLCPELVPAETPVVRAVLAAVVDEAAVEAVEASELAEEALAEEEAAAAALDAVEPVAVEVALLSASAAAPLPYVSMELHWHIIRDGWTYVVTVAVVATADDSVAAQVASVGRTLPETPPQMLFAKARASVFRSH